MTEFELMSRAEMVRSPMAAAPILSPPLPGDSTDGAVELVLDPDAKQSGQAAPEHLWAGIENSDKGGSQASDDL